MKYIVSKFNDDGSIYPIYECEDEEEAMKTAYACNGVYEKVSPSLSDDQQVVLEWLKSNLEKGNYPMMAIVNMQNIDEGDPCFYAYENMTTKEDWEVLAAFAEWGSKEEHS